MGSLKICSLFQCMAILIMLNFSSYEARDFLVDGQNNSWKIPSSPDQFNKWSKKTRFKIGDSLVMEYDPKQDSVLEVTEGDYKNCNKANPIKSFNDGKTKIELDRSGPFYFISGADGHCEKGQKLQVHVLSAKHSGPATAATTHTPAPAPSPVGRYAPAPASAGGYRLKIEGLSIGLGLVMVTLVGFALF